MNKNIQTNIQTNINPKRGGISPISTPLLLRESLLVARLYLKYSHWPTVRAQVMDQNLLQARTINTRQHFYQVVSNRLKTLSPELLTLLDKGSNQEQRHILWLAICLRSPFVHHFAVEVIRENFIQLNPTLTYLQYDQFFNQKATLHRELEKLAKSSREKMRQVTFKVLRDVGILSNKNVITPVFLSKQLEKIIIPFCPHCLAIFPTLHTTNTTDGRRTK